MNLSISKQKELDEAYDTLIQVCLYDRPLEDMVPLLADDVMNFGAGRKEITKTSEEFLHQIKGQKELASGLTMNFKFNPVLRKITNDGNGAIYTDDIINTVWINEVETELKFRLSFIFEYRDNKWLLVHSHTSAPDSQRTDDEVWPVEELKKRTAVLEKSLDEKIAELEIKNRELQIDSALERTRTQSMLMQHSEQLDDTLRIFHEQILLLGINSAFSFLWLPDEKNDRHIFRAAWAENQSNDLFDRNSIVLKSKAIDYPLDRNEPATAQCLIDWKGEESVVSYHVPPEGVDAYFAAWQELIAGVEKLKPEYFSDGLYYVEAFIKYGCFGVMVKDELSAEEKKILLRFAVEFERTYTRFLGLQEAEANAREARIEASLERIRSRAMAMRNTEELLDAADLVGKELSALGIESMNVSYAFLSEDQKSASYFSVNPIDGKILPFPFVFPHTETEVMRSILRSWKNQEPLNIQELDAEGSLNHQTWVGQHIRDLFETKGIAFSIEEFLQISPKKAVISTFNFTNGYLFSIGSALLSELQKDIFLRVTKVFDMTYRRFLDLQQAEAQAKEAQIQLALERVRARTMAMQKSNELPEAANVLFQQMQSLGMPAWSAGYCIWDENKQGITLWMSSEGVMQPSFHAPLTEDPSFIHMKEAYERGDDFHVEEVGGDALVSHYMYMRKLPVVGQILDSIIATGHPLPVFQIFHCVYFTQGFLLFITYEPVPESHGVFKRFGNVFDQTYTRFLDLQKAEAQAREAEIELALERVRARTMAMQKSEELKEVITVVFEQFVHLQFHIEHAGFVINYTPGGNWNFWVADQHSVPAQISVPYFDSVWGKGFIKAKENKQDFFTTLLDFEEKNKFYQELLGYISGLPEETIKFYLSCPGLAVSTVVFDNVSLYIENFSGFSYSEEEDVILKRFGKVFQQTYTRFLDLQKSELQARESQIQLALERVRARTMAMQHSNELSEAASLLFHQVLSLGTKQWGSGFNIWQSNEPVAVAWMANPDGSLGIPFSVPYSEDPFFKNIYAAMQRGEDFFVMDSAGKELENTYQYMYDLHDARRHFDLIESLGFQVPAFQTTHCAFFQQGFLMFITYEPVPEMWDIFRRFAKVFEQTYTRFLDLQKSEAQARESQIQLALERVRAKTMAMQKSEELGDCSFELVKQVQSLGIATWHCAFSIYDDDEESSTEWGSNEWGTYPKYKTPRVGIFKTYYDLGQKGETFHVEVIGKDRCADHYAWLSTLPGVGDELVKLRDAGVPFPTSQIDHVAYFKYGYLIFITYEPAPEAHEVFIRFARVFEQTYTRFLDLKNSEAQVREAKIEAALERVRSRTMAMQKSSELADVAVLLFNQVSEMGIKTWTTGFNVWSDDNNSYLDYITSPSGQLIDPYNVDTTSAEALTEIADARKSGNEFVVLYVDGEKITELYKALTASAHLQFEKMLEDGIRLPSHQYEHFVFGNKVSLMFITHEPVPEAYHIFRRLGKVFEQTYTRFLDLQKAESQARESQIEAALERVRSRTMAMQRSEELQDAAVLLFQQIRGLDVQPFACGFNIWDEDGKTATAWMTQENVLMPPFTYSTSEDVFFHIRAASQRGDLLFVKEQGGEELDIHYRYMASLPVFGDTLKQMAGMGLSLPSFQIIHCAFFAQGYLMFITYEPVREAYDIFKRFAKVFEQTYTRFLDLQKSEALAMETMKRASVDRVRAEIASMRSTSDLDRITPLIWNELTTLGVPFIRCGVFIMDEKEQQVHTFLSTPDGNALAAFHQPFNAPGEIADIVKSWQKNEMYRNHWDEARFNEFTKGLVEQGAISSGEKYITENHPTDLYLHFLPFLQGMLYVGNTSSLNNDELQLVQNLADAFSTAYARYEDFNKLEAAKEQVDRTLSDLKQAQSQLVQAEKMASLGELTAGIAHEIQNPLNFVNNFSEVNVELSEEILQAAINGNMDEIKLLAADIKSNQEKIREHGKRADSIVKGMLQHSRTTSGEKIPTDINVLADEYLRLAYHGLRAKDKSFNATLETDFDQSICKFNIIPQDIGRVLLNLISNAFYAVDEKNKSGMEGFEPTVTISTKMVNGSVELAVKDNGNGVPQRIMDKIFQPFFTTKPTGQGTGLGLSLAYDIVKAHGGELKAETKEQEGSCFTIHIPYNRSE